MNPKARHNARFYAVQAMYEWQINHTPLHDLESDFLANHLKKNTDKEYFRELIHGVPHNIEALDKQMMPYLKRAIAELDPVELAILRLGNYELQHRLDIPYRVSINEWLELTKQFGSVEGYKFVNGILDQLARELRIDEVNAAKK